METSLHAITPPHRALAQALELLGLVGAAALSGRDDAATGHAAARPASPPAITINAHGLRVDARTARATVWLDIVPESPTSGLPKVTVFLDVANVATLRRQLEAIALALQAVDGNGEPGRPGALAPSGVPAADPDARAFEEI
jgi:hypothetical protein